MVVIRCARPIEKEGANLLEPKSMASSANWAGRIVAYTSKDLMLKTEKITIEALRILAPNFGLNSFPGLDGPPVIIARPVPPKNTKRCSAGNFLINKTILLCVPRS